MPYVTIHMFEGRTTEQKKQLVKDITEAFVKIGTPAEVVHVITHDLPKTNFSTGGKLASEPKS